MYRQEGILHGQDDGNGGGRRVKCDYVTGQL